MVFGHNHQHVSGGISEILIDTFVRLLFGPSGNPEDVYPKCYEDGHRLYAGLDKYFEYYYN